LRLPGGSGNTTRGEGVRRGVGFAVGFKNVCYSEGFDDSTAARVRLAASDDGIAAVVHCAAAEVGQGVVNVILQTARTELDLDQVVLGSATTSSVGSAGSASASRMTWMAAGAVQLACRAAKEELERRGGDLEHGDTIDVERVYHHRPTTPLDPETGQVTGDGAHVAYICAAMRVVAEVDVELGLTRVVWIGTAQDVGKAVNPQAVYGQIEGGTAQGLGLALMEEIQTRDGLIANASFTDYLIPTTLDMPPVVAELVEEPEPDAPYGVKGVGEAEGRAGGGVGRVELVRAVRGQRHGRDHGAACQHLVRSRGEGVARHRHPWGEEGADSPHQRGEDGQQQIAEGSRAAAGLDQHGDSDEAEQQAGDRNEIGPLARGEAQQQDPKRDRRDDQRRQPDRHLPLGQEEQRVGAGEQDPDQQRGGGLGS